MFRRSRPQVVAMSYDRGGSGIWTLTLLAIVSLCVFLMTYLGGVDFSDVLRDMFRAIQSLVW